MAADASLGVKEPSSSRILLGGIDPSEAMLKSELHARRTGFLWTGVLALATAPGDWIIYNPHPWLSLALRLLMAVSCWIAAWEFDRLDARAMERLNVGVAFAACSLYTALAAVSGGVHSTAFVWTPVMPIVGVVIAGDSLWLAIGYSLLNAAVAAALVHAAHLPTGTLVNEVMYRVSAGAIAVIVALFQRRLRGNLRQLAGDLRESKERVVQSQRLAFVGQLAAGVAHEINNPLSFVLSNVEFVRNELGEHGDKEHLAALDEAIVGSRRIRQIVADLRALSRTDSDGGAACELPGAVDEAVRLAGRRVEGVRIEQAVAAVPRVQMAHHRVVQVLVNLLVNAADAVADTGRADGLVTVRARLDGDAVALDVVDNGPGFLPGQLERLFTPFYTTKKGVKSGTGVGLGLGLALCHAYLEQAGGSITAENAPSGGAQFHVRLPVAK